MQEEKPMRTLNVEEISKNIKEMCIEANHFLSKDMDIAMKNAVSTEKSSPRSYLNNSSSFS